MGLRIAVLDFTYTLLGPATALQQLGHEVSVFVPRDAGPLPTYHAALLDRFFGGGSSQPDFGADVVIYAEAFADSYWALQHGCQMDSACFPQAPLANSINPLQLDLRLDHLHERLSQVPNLVLVDMSDLAEPLHPAFLDLPGTKLKRELLPGQRQLGIEPFPFLYNPVLLTLERVLGLEACRPESPDLVWDGWFCGTIDHWRYGGERRRCLEVLRARHPQANFGVATGGMPTVENLKHVQRSRTLLHPPGRGEICLRTHEGLFFGVPLLVAEPLRVCLPAGFERVFRTHLTSLPSSAEVRDYYARAFSPEAAASVLQEKCFAWA